MQLVSIAQIAQMKDKAPIEAIQGRISRVFGPEAWNGKPKQNAELQDAAGNTVRITAWEHPDMAPMEGMDVIIQSGPKGGVSVNTYKGVNSLSISKTGTFQRLAVHQAQHGNVPAAASAPQEAPPPAAPAQQGPPKIRGEKVGMAINNACNMLVSAGEPFSPERVYQVASDIIRVSVRLEDGVLASEKPF